jgi:hypothetical protein
MTAGIGTSLATSDTERAAAAYGLTELS